MTQGLTFDDANVQRLVAVYTTPDVVAQRQAILNALALHPGERVLDIGSGPGFLAASMSEAVGPAGKVEGIDLSGDLVAFSRALCAAQPWVQFRQGDAVNLPFPDAAFDVAVSTQVLEYVRDVDQAIQEIHRVLRPGGRAIIVDTDWDSIVWHSGDPQRMGRVLSAWEEHLADPHLPRTLRLRLSKAGFRVNGCAVIPLLNATYDEATYSYRVLDLMVPFVAGRRGVTVAEAAAWADDLRLRCKEGDYFFSLNRYLFEAVKLQRDP